MKFGILSLITALTISAVAIYYSVAGLVAIFAAAPIAIIIMGGTLEISKLVVAAWLHRYWDRAALWIKIYFTSAIVVLMVLTSVGIFGFLSKSHTEQTALSTENVAQIARIEGEIARQKTIVTRAEERIQRTESVGSGADVNVQAQIDREVARVDQAFERLKEAEAGLTDRLLPYKNELTGIDTVLSQLQEAINQNNIRQAQSIVGTDPDGRYGPRTAERVEAFRAAQLERRQALLQQVEEIRSAGTSRTALATQQVAEGNALINRLRDQLGVTETADIDLLIDEQQERVRTATSTIDKLTDEKFTLEIEYRKLEAEVGPIKYVAEFVYGEANTNLLEEAVRWMIILIIIVFDPLAVALLLASQYTFRWHREDNPEPETKKKSWGEWFDEPEVERDDLYEFPGNDVDKEIDEREFEDPLARYLERGMYSYGPGFKHSTTLPEEEPEEEFKKDTDASFVSYADDPDTEVTEEDREWYKTLNKDELSRKELYEHLDSLGEWKEAKRAWKSRNPDLTIKEYKRAYIRGSIDDLPWYD
jgi:flagellar basal body-associated protein FliL